ncbi:RNA polymerase sigma factor SigF [Streptomyces sp. NBC_01142]|uniref:RNA polymerase sigma factor SigF n=1 Tax=Streptomyces sp. NBC_01142 TaxID=2975865 RepID=UPI002254264F|nr:RNA polymerase sigma factor SigF [Streptomyces sp. NBC_01142]MCX4820938.1 RNA polymerase sigma factor SigF [Streptomyces sp. NBC_01142]
MTSPVRDHPCSLSLDRHTAVATTVPAPDPNVPHGLPRFGVLTDVAPADARALSKPLFARLDALEEGTAEYAYVRNTLVELNLTLVHHAARRLRTRGESMEDVLQVGTIGLIKAINRFDPARGSEFTTFALPTIIGEIKRFFRDTTWAVRVPRRLQELRLTLQSATAALEQDLGRPPTVAELAEHLNLEPDEVVEGLAAANGYSAASLDAQTDDAATDTLADHIGIHDVDMERIEELVALKPLIATLPERDRRILALRFVHDLTQAEIGVELGISQMHVSRLLARTLARMRTRLGSER